LFPRMSFPGLPMISVSVTSPSLNALTFTLHRV
jgi:hypothetical protein